MKAPLRGLSNKVINGHFSKLFNAILPGSRLVIAKDARITLLTREMHQ